MSRTIVLIVFIGLVVCEAATNFTSHVNVCSRADYSQCDPKWANQQLPCGQTICDVGCAMSSVAEALKGEFTPATLNAWLKVHGGYDGCELVWGAVDSLGLTYVEQTTHDLQWMIDHSQNCNYAIIANVRDGRHWVLITGYAGNGNFYVNDPDNFQKTYSYGDILRESVYTY